MRLEYKIEKIDDKLVLVDLTINGWITIRGIEVSLGFVKFPMNITINESLVKRNLREAIRKEVYRAGN